MKRLLSFLAAALLLVSACPAARADGALNEAVLASPWYQDERAHLTVGNPTPLRGRFFTSMWGGTTSDLDVQELLHAASPVRWDAGIDRYRFDKSVVEGAVVMNDADGNRVCLLSLAADLRWSDNTPITVKDYVFSLLLQMDPAVAETGGTPGDFSWLVGVDEYLSGEAKALSGVRILSEDMLQITVKAEALPYFYELNRLNIHPYPADVIAPGTEVLDDGEGAYLSAPLTAETLRQTVLDEKTGYLSHPRKVSGPYLLESFDGVTAKFVVNPYFKGTEEGMLPRIGRIEYTLAGNSDMIYRLQSREIDLLDKVTRSDSILGGIRTLKDEPDKMDMENEPRTGLTMIWFMETSERVSEKAVREAIASSFDRDAFIREYAGPFGLRTDGFFGLGEWMYRLAAGQAEYPVVLPENPTEAEQAEYDAAVGEWQTVSLDGLTVYGPYPKLAAKLLDRAGWNKNENGRAFDAANDRIRCKETEGGLTPLSLTMAVPETENPSEALEKTLVAPLRKIGIELKLVPMSMEALQEAYDGRTPGDFDMLYLGENFTGILDPGILAPHTENEGSELVQAKKEVYGLALDMVRTEPEDLLGFVRKWITLQERITQTLPLLPVYTNVYFEFFNRKLHDFSLAGHATWAEAIVNSYMSDIEILTEEQKKLAEEKLSEVEEKLK